VIEFEAFYAATWPRLYRTTWLVAGDAQHAEDALQTAMAQAYSRWAKVSAARDPEAYVRKMAVNAALQRFRRSATRRETLTGTVEPGLVRDADVVEQRSMWEAVLALPPRQRAVVVLRYYEDLSEQQIAEVLGCRPGTVKSLASTALGRLRQVLGDVELEGDHR
jgi:RNA polymerase sigma-70 factor (sigma-E family)